MLSDFVERNRKTILQRARTRVAARNSPLATEVELRHGLPIFLKQLGDALRKESSRDVADHAHLKESAGLHGSDLFDQGLTAAQVVHDYGDLCQVITGLAVEQAADIGVEEFQTLNLCLDDAIAGAVTSFSARRERAVSDEGTERLGELAHELRNLLGSAMLAFASIKRGGVTASGSTGALLERNLVGLQTLVDRSLAEVRLDAGIERMERVPLWEVLEEVAIGASLFAQRRELTLDVAPVDHAVHVDADRQILSASIANLVQNALKYTRPRTAVVLRTLTTPTRVLLEVQDQCGGLPEGQADTLMRPFTQKGQDRTGLGLGLSICLKAMTAMRGELRVRDLPGIGCVFTIDLPISVPPSAESQRFANRDQASGKAPAPPAVDAGTGGDLDDPSGVRKVQS